MSTTPDYGEPWRELTCDMNGYLLNDAKFRRAVRCVNACQGMADPAAEIKNIKLALDLSNEEAVTRIKELEAKDAEIEAMRKAIQDAHDALEMISVGDSSFQQRNEASAALAKLNPFTTLP